MKTIKTRGRTFTGTVTSDKMTKTVTVQWDRRHYIPKFERYEKRKSVVKAHNPEEIDAKVGDIVVIKETRPLSKTKHFIVVEKIDPKAEKASKSATQKITKPSNETATKTEIVEDVKEEKAEVKKVVKKTETNISESSPKAKKTAKKAVKKTTTKSE